ncbi:MAG: aminotransferase class I/II-fold pyridoxal phosphate-dependent enzyme [Oscillospiraceae bacterium]|nr:aminotransferase class I/II-fold pyridoxal phosphate-dependent enzyme [Oscillospiraceae bacterium]
MLYFENDYTEGACPEVLEALVKTNMESLGTYGFDSYSASAKEKIKTACKCPDAEIYFLTGGTQTNKTVIDAVLRKYEGVIAAASGHIALHEAGAIESAGHKVITLPQKDGKLKAEDAETYLRDFYNDDSHDHMVIPGMMYISHPTEYGTLYTKKELEDLSTVSKKYNIPLFLDGARLGYGLMAEGTDVTLPDIAKYCDVFYIGGTKVGALCGEAVVFTKKAPTQFFTSIKQNGALLAKGRLNGVQFDRLFTDNLYLKISENAIKTAKKLKKAFKEKGYRFFIDSPTNQIFIVLENSKMETLKKNIIFSFWEKFDDNHTVVRFATSWATKEENIDELIKLL